MRGHHVRVAEGHHEVDLVADRSSGGAAVLQHLRLDVCLCSGGRGLGGGGASGGGVHVGDSSSVSGSKGRSCSLHMQEAHVASRAFMLV